jgi:hypothetical protein
LEHINGCALLFATARRIPKQLCRVILFRNLKPERCDPEILNRRLSFDADGCAQDRHFARQLVRSVMRCRLEYRSV